jgi:hypothetical protein
MTRGLLYIPLVVLYGFYILWRWAARVPKCPVIDVLMFPVWQTFDSSLRLVLRTPVVARMADPMSEKAWEATSSSSIVEDGKEADDKFEGLSLYGEEKDDLDFSRDLDGLIKDVRWLES